MKYLFFSLFFIANAYFTYLYACHQSTVTEVSATDNGDGTYDYEIEVCMGSEDTWGFVLEFGADIVSVNTATITSATTGVTIGWTLIATNAVEYGEFDDTSNPIFHEQGDGQQCFIISVTLDAPSADVILIGTEYTFGPCGDISPTTACFGDIQGNGDITNTTGPCTPDGEIELSPTGGAAPYSYSWDTGATGATITGIEPGDYEVTITDNNGCSTEETYFVDNGGPMDNLAFEEADITNTSALCEAGGDGEITAQGTGGTEPYTYDWSTGDSGPTISDLDAGDYTVTITDAEGCQVSETYTVEDSGGQSGEWMEVVVTSPDCRSRNNSDIEWEVLDENNNVIGSGSQDTDDPSSTNMICGCGSVLEITNVPEPQGNNPENCHDGTDLADDNGQIEVFNSAGVSLGVATADGETIDELDCVLLPIELGEVNSYYFELEDVNIIEWTTITETNNNYFVIKHSSNGIDWREISTVSGAGTSLSPINYQYKHEHFNREVINYYSINQVDYNGISREVSILSIDNLSDKTLIKTVNMLGQEVGENYKGIVIYYYSDGSILKSFN